MKPTMKVNEFYTSYGLKDIAEKDIGDYISNDEFKEAANSMGYVGVLSDTPGNPNYKFKFTSEDEKLNHDKELCEVTEGELRFEIGLNKEERQLHRKR
jgi:hypothetical protein